MSTVDFVKKCIEYYGYKPKTIQTDNGTEFGYNQAKIKKEHPMDKLLKQLNINHYKIRPRTPEHNGKVERSHRKDQERFYYKRIFLFSFYGRKCKLRRLLLPTISICIIILISRQLFKLNLA